MKANKMLLGIILGSMMSCGVSFGMQGPSNKLQGKQPLSYYQQLQQHAGNAYNWAGNKVGNASAWLGQYMPNTPQWAKNIVNKLSEYKKTTLLVTLAAALGYNVYRNPDGTVASLVKSTMEYGGKKVAEGQEYFTEGAGAGYLANASEGGRSLYQGARSGLGKAANYVYENPGRTAAAVGGAGALAGAGTYGYKKYRNYKMEQHRNNLIEKIINLGSPANEQVKNDMRKDLEMNSIKELEDILATMQNSSLQI